MGESGDTEQSVVVSDDQPGLVLELLTAVESIDDGHCLSTVT